MVLSKEGLILRSSKGELFEFTFFWGHQPAKSSGLTKSCFSQWWESEFTTNGCKFPTAEHYMMHRKALLFGDFTTAGAILTAATPRTAKDLGRKVHGYKEDTWRLHREEIVYTGNLLKFSQSPELKSFLLSTGDHVLVEASPVDTIWGIGLAAGTVESLEPASWPGLNLLGFALMKVRETLENKV